MQKRMAYRELDVIYNNECIQLRISGVHQQPFYLNIIKGTTTYCTCCYCCCWYYFAAIVVIATFTVAAVVIAAIVVVVCWYYFAAIVVIATFSSNGLFRPRWMGKQGRKCEWTRQYLPWIA